MSLTKYLVRRALYLIPVFFGITLLVFSIERLAGDPVQLLTNLNPLIMEADRQRLRQYFGLDKPVYIQYLIWVSQLEIQLLGLAFSLAIAIPIGILSAKRRYSLVDVSISSSALVGTSIPIFFLGIIFILGFGYYLHIFPSGGAESTIPSQYPLGSLFLDQVWHLTLPTAVYTFAILAPVVLLVRSSMLEVLRQDFILAARASGLSERSVIYKHALKNALIPIVTYVGLYFGGLLAGAPVTETVFNWPGVGQLFVQATNVLDFPVVQGIVVIITLMTLIANLVIDITYGYIDPRIRLE